MKRSILTAISAMILVTLACASSIQVNAPGDTSGPSATLDVNESPSAGDPARGKLLFSGQVNGEFHCSNCHSLVPGQILVGPSLAGIASTATTRIDGYSADEYLRESIVATNAYVVDGYQPDIMPENFGKQMTEEQMADLIAYLMTLK